MSRFLNCFNFKQKTDIYNISIFVKNKNDLIFMYISAIDMYWQWSLKNICCFQNLVSVSYNDKMIFKIDRERTARLNSFQKNTQKGATLAPSLCQACVIWARRPNKKMLHLWCLKTIL